VVRQCDYSLPQPAQRFSPRDFDKWLVKQLTQASRVVVCYEAGCFGYEPARRMQRMGAEVLVIAPQNWDERGKRQAHDKLDAMVMCRRLSEYLSGHHKALSIVCIPTPAEEEARAQVRFREQLRRGIRRMQAMGRSLLLQREVRVSGRWWRGSTWTELCAKVPAWVLAQLETWKALIEANELQAAQVERAITAAAPGAELFKGEGRLSHEVLRREMLKAERFQNSRQVGNYFGLCPSESSSGSSQLRGSITKTGNPRLRRILIEMAWRLVRYQPEYRGCKRWAGVLGIKTADQPAPPKSPSSARKKAIVALARQLAVDLWRLNTKRITAAELGLQ
jgi:transposase